MVAASSTRKASKYPTVSIKNPRRVPVACFGVGWTDAVALQTQAWLRPNGGVSLSEDAGRQALQAMSRFLVADASLGEALLAVAQIATDAMPAAEMAGIAMLDP